MFCSRMGNGISITCTTTYQKWTGQPIPSAGSKNPLPLGMGSVKDLGKFMDPLADKLLTTTAFLYMLKGGALMTEVVVLLVGREFLVSGVRMLAAGSIQKAVIPANFLGKLKTVLMMFMIIFYYGVMWIVGETPWLIPTVTVMSWVCVASSVISGISYIFFSKDIIKDSH